MFKSIFSDNLNRLVYQNKLGEFKYATNDPNGKGELLYLGGSEGKMKIEATKRRAQENKEQGEMREYLARENAKEEKAAILAAGPKELKDEAARIDDRTYEIIRSIANNHHVSLTKRQMTLPAYIWRNNKLPSGLKGSEIPNLLFPTFQALSDIRTECEKYHSGRKRLSRSALNTLRTKLEGIGEVYGAFAKTRANERLGLTPVEFNVDGVEKAKLYAINKKYSKKEMIKILGSKMASFEAHFTNDFKGFTGAKMLHIVKNNPGRIKLNTKIELGGYNVYIQKGRNDKLMMVFGKGTNIEEYSFVTDVTAAEMKKAKRYSYFKLTPEQIKNKIAKAPAKTQRVAQRKPKNEEWMPKSI